MRRIAEQTSFNEPRTVEDEAKIRKIFDEEFEVAKERIWTKIKSRLREGDETSARRTKLRLTFRSKLSPEILTGEEIRGEGGTPIEVALVDDETEKVVDEGPEAFANVGFHLLKGDNSTVEEEFSQKIIPEVQGKRPLLDGNDVTITLQSGIGVVKNIKLRNHATQIRPSEFKLGARVFGASASGDRIKEAETETFIVKDFRNKYCRKHKTPSLSDEVFRLANIGKGGNIHKRLQENQINTVEDFLIRLLKNHEELKSIVKLRTQQWEETVKNARACLRENRMYCYTYTNLEQNKIVGVVFDVLGEVLGLYSESRYSPSIMLSEEDKADARELLPSAYEDWGRVKSFDDMNSLQHYFTYLGTLMTQPREPVANPDYLAPGLENIVTSENIFLNTNSITDIGADNWFDTDNYNMQFGHLWNLNLWQDVCGPSQQYYGGNEQL